MLKKEDEILLLLMDKVHLEKAIRRLEKENKKLRKQVRKLKKEPDTIDWGEVEEIRE